MTPQDEPAELRKQSASGPSEAEISRRAMLFKFGLVFNGLVAAMLAVPILGYILSPAIREKKVGYESWLSLGGLEKFPTGETRLATYRNPVVTPWDGQTADIACWVRNVDGQKFQVFAINCAHLGCPVRWFPKSGLFLCPCHGGAYYEDGTRASGPPERGLFEYPHKIQDGVLFIKAGELPTPGRAAYDVQGRPTCA
jgi:quinol---cytochrome c reductase iron-sulfur subunit, bacillus type